MTEAPWTPIGERRRGGWRAAARAALWLGLTALSALGAGGLWLYGHVARGLPPVPDAELLLSERPTIFYARDGRVVGHLGLARAPAPLEAFPRDVVAAFLAAEDQRFFRHAGVDLRGTARALWANLVAGRTVQGASTLTQQLCKGVVGRERTWRRKLREAILARRTEQVRSKEEILELYLNTIYLGHGAYGVPAAARRYFDKDLSALSLGEAALLAGLPPRPGQRNPVVDAEGSHRRQRWVLERMVQEGFIEPAAAAAAGRRVSLRTTPDVFRLEAPYYVEHARRLLTEALGEDLPAAGLRVRLALDPEAQAAARVALQAAVLGLALRRAGAGAPSAAGELEAAWVALDPQGGGVTALVGGLDYDRSEYHRVFQGCRQPGSAFKPFVYALALDEGYTLASLLDDTPLVRDEGVGLWKPANAGRYAGDVLLHTAIVASKNVPAVRLLETLGPARVARFATTLGIDTPLDPTPALALGSGCVRPWALTAAYGAFAAGGRALRPVVISRVEGADGRVYLDRTDPVDPWAPGAARLDGLLRRAFEPRPALIEARTAWLTRAALRAVVRGGTGVAARRLGKAAAGKTGTTDAFDAWFVGFTDERLATIWIGSDRNRRPLGSGETGAHLAAPAWAAALAEALEGVPQGPLPGPAEAGITWAAVDPGTGRLAGEGGPSLHLPFKSGTEPAPTTDRAPPAGRFDRRDFDHVEGRF